MTIIFNTAEQGSEEWLLVRRGAITGSRIRDMRDRLRDGRPSSKATLYAMDLAREREGGSVLRPFVSQAMQTGTQQEPIARARYEEQTGEMVETVGFAHTGDGRFGCSLDGRVIGSKGAIEIKTLVGSESLFTALVNGDTSAYRDQCLFAMWLLSLDWVDLVLWVPDLDLMKIIRVERDEDEIQRLEDDLIAFDSLVEQYRGKLHAARSVETPASILGLVNPAPPRVQMAPSALPETLF